jgi:uncharacterized protein YprB with RNaseH-like and TPR domain
LKVLFFDIETTPLVSYTWERWQTNVIKVKRSSELICVGYRWKGEKTRCIDRYGEATDEKLVRKVWKLFDQADVIIGHNGDAFDIKRVNARFAKYNLPPPSGYKTLDTKKIAKKEFGFDSNSLNDLAEFLGIGTKKDTGGFATWEGCMAGVKAAFRKMIYYCKGDVDLLVKVYYRLVPYLRTHKKVTNEELRGI